MTQSVPTTSPGRKRIWRSALPGLGIVALVFLAYLPVWRAEFIWDDDSNIIESRPLRSLNGLRRIWLEPGATQQYYPLTHSSFWLDYHVWGLDHPTGYHVENVLLHATSAVLLWLLLRRLGMKGAWLGATLFALHPLNAESVAWVTERKNTLSGVFFMGSLLASLKFWRLEKPPVAGANAGTAVANAAAEFGPWKYYFLTLAFYLCALWSKTATVGLPAVIWLLVWWKRSWPRLKETLLLAPLAALGLGMSLMTMWVERNHLGVTGEVFGGLTWLERCFVAGRAFWFYLGKLAWPRPLMFMYPRWTIHTSDALNCLPILAALGGLALLWGERRTWGRPALLAAGCYMVMIFPVLGFFGTSFFMYSFVNDHFQYLAGIGPLALAAAGITMATDRFSKDKPLLKPAVNGVLLLVLGVVTCVHAVVFSDLETLWRDTLAHNPDSWMAHDNLGTALSNEGRFGGAADQYHAAITLNTNDFRAYNNLGLDLARQGEVDGAIQDFNKSLALMPDYVMGHYNLGRVLASRGKMDEAIQHLRRAAQLDSEFAPAQFNLGLALEKNGNLDEAIEHYQKMTELEPRYAPAQADWGRVLATRGKTNEAVEHYRKALELDPASVDALANLANVFVKQGKYDEAITDYRAALQIKPESAVLHYDLGVALERSGNHAEAQTEIAEAQRLNAMGATAPPPAAQ